MGTEKTDVFSEDTGEKYYQLFEAMVEGVFWQKVDGSLVDVNPAALEIFGLTREEFVKRTVRGPQWNIVNEDGLELRADKYPSEIALKTGQAVKNRILGIYNSVKEKYVWVNLNAVPQFREGETEPYQVFVTLHDITETKKLEDKLREEEEQLRLKLSSVLSPDYDMGDLELENIIDIKEFQALIDDFYTLTKIGIGVIDLKGKVLVGAGWQDVCTCFYRVHPETHEKCLKSDLVLTQNLKEGEIRGYKCMNDMWDIATPIFIGGKHVGNIFLGQFFYEDEVPDYDLFSRQAEEYGFNKSEFFEALSKVPRWSKKQVIATMHFYSRLALLLSNLSYSNLKLARELVERKKLEKELRESKELYQSLVDESPVGIMAIRDNQVVFANPEIVKGFGFSSPDEVVGMNPLDLFNPEDHHLISKRLENVSKGKRNDPIAIPVKKKNGSTIYVEYVSVPVIMDGKPTILIEGKDVTARIKAEQALKESEEKFRRLAENAQNMIYRMSIPDGKYEYVSPASELLFGYSPEEFYSNNLLIKEVLHPDYIEYFQEKWENLLQGKVDPTYEYCIIHKSGEKRCFNQRNVLIRDDAGNPIALEGIVTDVTDFRNAEAELMETERKFL